jgi:hypothetical protein
MALACYIDESGTHDQTGRLAGSDVAVLAGCLADEALWSELEKPWRSVLDEFKVPFLHTSEFSAQQHNPDKEMSPYYQWPREKQEMFIMRLCEVVSAFRILKVGRGVHVDDYDKVFSEELKEVFHPWMFCFWQLMGEFLFIEGSRIAQSLKRGEEVAFLFDQQKEFGPRAHALFLRFKELINPDGTLGTIEFVSKERCIPIQVADLVVFRMRKRESRTRRDGTGVVELAPGTWDYLLFAENAGFAYYDADALRKIAPGFEKIPGFRDWAIRMGFHGF